MMTEKIRVSASSVIKSDPEMSATAASVGREGGGAVDIIGESVTFAYARGAPPLARSRLASMAYHEGTKKHEDHEE